MAYSKSKRIHESQAAGRKTAISQKAEHIIHNKNGKIGARNSYGNDPHPPKDNKPLYSVWFANTNKTVTEIRDGAKRHIDSNDKIFAAKWNAESGYLDGHLIICQRV